MGKRKWKIQSNSLAGIGTVYRAVRIIDPNSPEHSGNLEIYGEWCEDLDAVKQTVAELNEQPDTFSDSLRLCVCPICQTKFIPTSEWHWTHGKYRFCRYHCYLQRKSLEAPKCDNRNSRVRQFSLTGEIIATYANAEEAARSAECHVGTIRAACNRHQPLGTGYRWEYVGKGRDTDEKTSAQNS